MWDADANQLKDAIIAAIGPEAMEYEIRFRPMFGGIMTYAFGRPFASLSHAGIGVKLSEEDRNALIKLGGYPLRYKESDPPSKSYTIIPMTLVDDGGEALKSWLTKSMIHCKTLPLKIKKKKK